MRIHLASESLHIEFRGTEIGQRCVVPYLSETSRTRRTDLAGSSPDITVEEGQAAETVHRPRSPSLVLPMHVHMVVHLPTDPDELSRLLPLKQRAGVRRYTRRHGYEWRVSADEAEFLDFYDRMYVPTVEARHGSRAMRVTREEALERIFRAGNLLLLTANGTPVGGSAHVLHPDRGLVVGRLAGVLDGDETHLRQGVVKTLNHRLLEWACAAGYRTVDLQGCEPFPRVGTFRYKALLGAGVVEAPGLTGFRLRLTVHRDTPAVRDFLTRNPMIVFDEHDRLGAVYFTSEGSQPEIVHVRHGLSFLRIADLDEFLT